MSRLNTLLKPNLDLSRCVRPRGGQQQIGGGQSVQQNRIGGESQGQGQFGGQTQFGQDNQQGQFGGHNGFEQGRQGLGQNLDQGQFEARGQGTFQGPNQIGGNQFERNGQRQSPIGQQSNFRQGENRALQNQQNQNDLQSLQRSQMIQNAINARAQARDQALLRDQQERQNAINAQGQARILERVRSGGLGFDETPQDPKTQEHSNASGLKTAATSTEDDGELEAIAGLVSKGLTFQTDIITGILGGIGNLIKNTGDEVPTEERPSLSKPSQFTK